MIAVLDSGSGGANLIKQCLKHYNYDFVYLVDNKNCPYGNLPKDKLKQIVMENIEYLMNNYQIDFVLIGCNTASSILGYKELENIKCPILKTNPNMQALVKTKDKKLLFATKNTLKYSKLVKYYLLSYSDIKTIYIKNLPKLIDEKISNNCFIINKKLQKKLKKHFFFNNKLKIKYKKIKSIALGCTHFKYIENNLKELFNNICIVYCEENIAKISKFLINKSLQKSTIKVILTKKDDKLQSSIEKMFDDLT